MDRLADSTAENRRFYVRLQHSGAPQALLRIVKEGRNDVKLKPGLIQLLDVSPGGCGFYSSLRFPVNPHILCLVEWETEGERFRLPGGLRWRKQEDNGFHYGIRFQLGLYERLRLHNALNRLILRLCPEQAKIHFLYRSQVAGGGYQRKRTI